MFVSVAPAVQYIINSSNNRREQEQKQLEHDKRVNAKYAAQCRILNDLKAKLNEIDRKWMVKLPKFKVTKLYQYSTNVYMISPEAYSNPEITEVKTIEVPLYIEYVDMVETESDQIYYKFLYNNQKMKAYKQLIKALTI